MGSAVDEVGCPDCGSTGHEIAPGAYGEPESLGPCLRCDGTGSNPKVHPERPDTDEEPF